MGKIKPVTFQDLKKIFSGRTFKASLKQASKCVLALDVETQFQVFREISNWQKYIHVPIPEASCTDDYKGTGGVHGLASEFLESKGLELDEDVLYVVHFHHHTGLYVAPSKNDLENMMDIHGLPYDKKRQTKIRNHPLLTIGALQEAGTRLDMLVLQHLGQPHRSNGQFAFDLVGQELGNRLDVNELVAETYNALENFNATLLRYTRNKNGTYSITQSEIDKLKRFAWDPKFIQK